MKYLDAINLMLESVGEHPVSSVDVKHPTVSKARTILEQVKTQTLGQGYWFNSFNATLTPDVYGAIGISEDVLSFVPTARTNVAIRGDKLYNGDTLNSVFDSPIEGKVTNNIEFEEMPAAARIAVANRAAVQLYGVDIGVDNNVNMYLENAALAMAQLDAEHVRQTKPNVRSRPQWAALQRARRI